MALSASGFIHPEGHLREEMFPDDDLATNVQQWLADAQERTTDLTGAAREKAKRRWVYHRAYAALVKRIRSTPMTAQLDDQGNWKWTEKQVRHFEDEAERYRREYEALARPAETPASPSFRTRRPRRPESRKRAGEYSAPRI
jgi:hypothetical protein